MEYLKGPDQIIPSDNYICCDPEGYVKLRSKDDAFNNAFKPLSVPGFLHKIASVYPKNVALVVKGKYKCFKTYTYEEYEMNVRFSAKAFLKLGLKARHSVCIMAFNCPEWLFSELGAIYAGGIATGIYATNSPEACEHVLVNSRANIVVVEDDVQLQKILKIKHRVPDLKAIIQMTGTPGREDVLSWNDFIELGNNQPDDELENALKRIAINECCILVYTSGTVGMPKGVMLNHDNILFDAQAMRDTVRMKNEEERVVSYLPLSHVAAQLVDIFLTMSSASALYFADKDALKGSLVKTLLVARPTRFLGVPRVWEKIQENMMAVGAQNGYIKKQIAAWAKEQGLANYYAKINGAKDESWGYYLANKLVFQKIKHALGLNLCTTFATAAAPLSEETKKYFMSIDIPIVEAYGMSECSGAHTINIPEGIDFKSVGFKLSGLETKITKIEGQEHGEICYWGRHVFMGYLNDVKKTEESTDEEGWLHSGDIGYLDENQKIYVTGRIKELLITAGGENIAPVPIEHCILQNMPFVHTAVLIGDKRKFLSVLLTLKTEVDAEGQCTTGLLTQDVIEWLKTLGSTATTITELVNEGPRPEVTQAVQKALNKVNENAISNAQKIQKFTILPSTFSIASGELGPTMKLRRPIVMEKYKDIVEGLYC